MAEKICVQGQKQKRMTKQKALVWEILSQTKSHPTAEWVYLEARKSMPNISLGTVYRNLQWLVTEGMAQELNYVKGISRFDANAQIHDHFVCERCGRIYDMDTSVKVAVAADKRQCGCGKIHGYRLEFYGVCCQCLEAAEKIN